MFKTGSKFLLWLAAFGFVAAVATAAATGDHAIGMDSLLGPLTLGYKGYVGNHVAYGLFMGLSVTSLFLAIFLAALHDADPDAEAQVAGLETVPEVVAPVTVNYWPVVGAFSLAAVALGLAIGPPMFVIGCVGLTITTIEWAVRAWSDRATGDPEVNRSIRDRFMHPIEIPVAALLGIGFVVLAVSRILLALPKTGSYLVFALVPVVVLSVGALIALRPRVSSSVVAGLLLVGGIALLAGGVIAAAAGERKHEGEHEKESGLAPSGSVTLDAPAATVIRVGS